MQKFRIKSLNDNKMRSSRYFWLNLLNLYFSKIGTVEFRPEAGTTSSTKCLVWLVVCASILKYAEDIKRSLSATSISLKEVLMENVGEKYTDYILEYLNLRHEYFFKKDGEYREYKHTEKGWFSEDNEFSFVHNNMEIK